MSTHIKYAYLRHNTWLYRRAFPKHLQPLLGAALKRSLKTADARTARTRVAELNLTYAHIIEEASSHVSALPAVPSNPEAPELGVTVPRYRRLRLRGDRPLAELVTPYLRTQSQRLRPGSFKSVRYALELLSSHLGTLTLGELTDQHGREVLGLLARLSPNIRKYAAAQGKTLEQLAALSAALETVSLTPQTQGRIWEQMQGFLDWCVQQGHLEVSPWTGLAVSQAPEPAPHSVLYDAQVVTLLLAQDRVLHRALLFALLTGLRSGELCGLMAEDIIAKGNLGCFVWVRPNAIRLLKSKAAEREVPLHPLLERLVEGHLPQQGPLFPTLTVDAVVKAYARLRRRLPDLTGSVFHSTRKWFITQCERTGTPEHFTASLVGHQSARSQNRLTYGLYSAGISDAQKRTIIDGIRLPRDVPPQVLP